MKKRDKSINSFPKRKAIRLKGKEYRSLVLRVFRRDRWTCKNPLCRKTRNLTPHHIIKRSQGGSDTEDNMITLCVKCHDEIHNMRIVLVRSSAPGMPWYVRAREVNDETGTYNT